MRHDEAGNPDGILYGQLLGFGLTELGYVMAAHAAEYLMDSGADTVRAISSLLLRAQLTATPTTAAYDLGIRSNPHLTESDDVLEGLPVNTNRAMLMDPKYFKYYCNLLCPSWGESYRDIASHMSAALSSALRETRGREVLVVPHQNPIVILTRFMNDQPLAHAPRSCHYTPASIMSFIFSDVTLVGTSYVEPTAGLVVTVKNMTPEGSQMDLHR